MLNARFNKAGNHQSGHSLTCDIQLYVFYVTTSTHTVQYNGKFILAYGCRVTTHLMPALVRERERERERERNSKWHNTISHTQYILQLQSYMYNRTTIVGYCQIWLWRNFYAYDSYPRSRHVDADAQVAQSERERVRELWERVALTKHIHSQWCNGPAGLYAGNSLVAMTAQRY